MQLLVVTDDVLRSRLIMRYGMLPTAAQEIVNEIQNHIDLDGLKIKKCVLEALVQKILEEVKVKDQDLFDLDFDKGRLTELLISK